MRTVKEQCIWHCISGKVKTTARNCHFLDTGHWPSKSKAQLPELQIKTFTRQIFWWENVPDTLFLVIPTRQKSPLLEVHFSSPSRRFAKLMFFSWRLSEKRMALTENHTQSGSHLLSHSYYRDERSFPMGHRHLHDNQPLLGSVFYDLVNTRRYKINKTSNDAFDKSWACLFPDSLDIHWKQTSMLQSKLGIFGFLKIIFQGHILSKPPG